MASIKSLFTSSLLSLYSSTARSTLRLREKYILLLTVATFVVFCIVGVFFLPDLKASTHYAFTQQFSGHGRRYPPPLRIDDQRGLDADEHGGFPAPAPVKSESDVYRLAEKVRKELRSINYTQQLGVLPKPYPMNVADRNANGGNVITSNNLNDWQPLKLIDGTPADPEMKRRRDFVRNMAKFAWDNYVLYAWGDNEYRPISKRGHSAGIFGKSKIGATIIDSMDTLFIMGLKEEFNQGRQWIESSFNFDEVHAEVSVFETTIRFIGGLLSCYAMTKDRMFLVKAEQIANRLLPAFNTPKGIPYSLINIQTGRAKNYHWASQSSSILSEIGTLHLEFSYLSDLINNPVFKEKVNNVRELLRNLQKPNGLYPNYINPQTGRWGLQHISMGALGDSFYEYLLKAWIQSAGKDVIARQMYDDAIAAMERTMIVRSPHGLLYFADMKFERLEHKMDHLACFSGGLLALGSVSMQQPDRDKYLHMGADITNTCHESYIRTETGLGPEAFRFTEQLEAKTKKPNEKIYLLRPETIESYFYLWRLTKDPKYREWAWEAAQALERNCRVENGYTGIKDVYDVNSPKDDVQQSYLLAETFKYLYLTFSDDNFVSLDEWVFNTEAHPLPIRGKNPAYPALPEVSTGDLGEYGNQDR